VKWLRLCVLVLLTLAVMRAASWALAWMLSRFTRARPRTVAVIANLVAFATFCVILNANLVPGEPVDWAALVFGLIVFALYALLDLYWRPWPLRASERPSVTERHGAGTRKAR
jgi:hypothetical protein